MIQYYTTKHISYHIKTSKYKEMCGLKGHSALRPCWCCANVILRKYFTGRMQCNFVDQTCIVKQSVVPHTASSFKAILPRLETAGLHAGADALHELEIVHGVRWVQNGLLYSEELRITPLNQMLDWCHVYLCGGLADVELGLLMSRLWKSKAPTSYAVLGRYMALWSWPKQYGRHGPSFAVLFNKKSAKANLDSGSFSSSASELLSMIPVLELYFDRVAKGRHHEPPARLPRDRIAAEHPLAAQRGLARGAGPCDPGAHGRVLRGVREGRGQAQTSRGRDASGGPLQEVGSVGALLHPRALPQARQIVCVNAAQHYIIRARHH